MPILPDGNVGLNLADEGYLILCWRLPAWRGADPDFHHDRDGILNGCMGFILGQDVVAMRLYTICLLRRFRWPSRRLPLVAKRMVPCGGAVDGGVDAPTIQVIRAKYCAHVCPCRRSVARIPSREDILLSAFGGPVAFVGRNHGLITSRRLRCHPLCINRSMGNWWKMVGGPPVCLSIPAVWAMRFCVGYFRVPISIGKS